MSYQTREQTAGFGEINRDNLPRNRAGQLAQQAMENDALGIAEFEEALTAIGDRDSVTANERLGNLTASGN